MYDDMISAVIRWVAAQTGLPTYRAGQDFNRPSDAHATVDLSIIDDVNDNHDAQSWTVDEESAAVNRRFEAELVFSVNIFDKEDPIAQMHKVKRAARAAETFAIDGIHDGGSGLAVHEVGPITPLRELENSLYVTRAQMNITARVHVIETSETEIIEEITPPTFERA